MKKLNKGFMFYFGILFAVLVAAFLICVVIMVLSPGTSYLVLNILRRMTTKYTAKWRFMSKLQRKTEVSTPLKRKHFFTDSSYTINKIIITSNAHNVKIVKANPAFKDPNSFLIDVTNSTHGFQPKKMLNHQKALDITPTQEFWKF